MKAKKASSPQARKAKKVKLTRTSLPDLEERDETARKIKGGLMYPRRGGW
jgi:hypothetical protein